MKSKKIFSALLVVIMTLSFVACSNKNVQTNADADTKEKKEVNNELEDKVVIYSTHGEAMLELVATEFEKETGVNVEFINLKGELADRVRAEKENPQSDIMFGGASSIFMELKEEDLFDQYEPSWGSDIDPLFKDSENFWFGTIQTPVMMFYNSDVIKPENAPKDWANLTNEQYKDQLVFRNALSSSARATFSSLLQQYEKANKLEDGWEFMKGMDANTKNYFSSGSLMFQSLGRKEAGISFATLNSIIDNKTKNNLPLEVIDAESGSPVITDGIALIKNAKHPNAAKAFIDFAGGVKIQGMFANEFNRMPTHPEAIKISPEWMGDIKFKIMDVDWANLSKKQSEWMQKWDSEIKDTAKDPK
ncbi:ABC transporter substrate-binding protein [Clostridium sediminicola]|uniref:extracellular solute-binding protein n=1 Tax=Clostridium sediminicola TaxID=3114879 RepID=UPI0031F1F633